MATMNDVAKLAGVSVSTVSYALTGVRPVTPETRARIHAAMDELGYQPNAIARSLASRRTHIIALLFPGIELGLSGTALEFVTSAAETAREEGYHLMLWPIGDDEVGETRNLIHQQLADGVLVMEVRLDDPRVDLLRESQTPFTLIGRTADAAGLDYADIDFDTTVRDALDHLIGLGHERIAFVSHSKASLDAGYGPTVRAGEAFERHMTERGLPVVARHCDESADAGRAVVSELWHAHPDITALITMNDAATFGAMAQLADDGRQVPRDVSVLSIASSPRVAALSHPRLTTMAAPGTELGRSGVRSLIERIEGSQSATLHELVPCRLDIQATTSPRTKE
ncbi:LacI family transcriptional regulator [Actinobacteria bacterium YIM 96077]|uniref:LacI family transcriptional regulator n=1 Tax=Phytoactinopolyspora halophila TaxID=1981511 RepID=A0A329QEB6_9ACTN|nr:LacI family DNA-binding transcriptional regulator [Phytoactinopolyspora halophila]AYY13429.1 LacI family transcriptional regulator [Actinobacteria bacterium YIM 96077]RAW10823.1 LacI family transcriptional regulator [Phytoactinopolyspora halophila]